MQSSSSPSCSPSHHHATAQTSKRVYISVDLEGISGVNGDDSASRARGHCRGEKLVLQRQGPDRVTLRYRNFTFPEVVTAFKEIESVAPDTVAFSRETMPEAYRLIPRALALYQP